MKIPEFCQALEKALVDEANPDNRLKLFSSALQQAFRVKEDEVALFRIDQETQELCFVWPKKLIKSGRIPVNARDSLSARTVREGKPHLDNRFSNTRHASIFERISLGDQKDKVKAPALPIQKIMSAPLLEGTMVKGVVQLSRKGLDPDSAGADFTPAELEAFASIVSAVAGHVPC
jgi:hypothetical protein